MSYWGADSGEGEFVFYKGQLLAGCMDKAQFGKFGLVHAMQVRAHGLIFFSSRDGGVTASQLLLECGPGQTCSTQLSQGAGV